MRRSICFLIAILALAAPARGASPSAEEFVGPFRSWADAKRDFGAKGDGKADDSDAIQRALDALREHRRFNVLYLPAGIYRIAKTVRTVRKEHANCLGVSVIGADPATTILRWDGPPGGTMFQYDAWYSKISRLTLDGAGKAGVALAYGDAFSTYNETSDMVFKDCDAGMRMGTASDGQAENEVLRCRFLRCEKAGLATDNFNSMDEWVWHCRFEDCGYGLLNQAGNFHAYQNLFLRSKIMDVGIQNLMVFSLVNNVSLGSKCFMDWESGHSWGAQTSVTGNRIADSTGDFAVRLGSAGPFLFAYNAIKSRKGKRGPEVLMTWGDQVFAGNAYSVADPVKERGRFRRLDERIVAPDRMKIAPPALSGPPPRKNRPVIDLPAGASAETIQRAIEKANRLRGKRPVIHLPAGNYAIDRELTIPAGCDLQLIGDGGAETGTVLQWKGRPGEPLLTLKGPARATLRDFAIMAGSGVGIRVTNADQPEGRIFGDQANVTGGGEKGETGLWVDGIDRGDVLMRCLQGGSNLVNWVKVTGGSARSTGKAASGQTSVLCGATGTSDGPYLVEKGGRLVVRSVYHEVSGEAPQAIRLDDSGSLFIDATRFSYATKADRPLILLNGFKGEFALATSLLLPVGSEQPARIEIDGDGSKTSVLALGNCFWQNRAGTTTDELWKSRANPSARSAMIECDMNVNAKRPDDPSKSADGYATVENRGIGDDSFLRQMLSPLRNLRIWTPTDGPPDATALQLHRIMVMIGKGGRGIELRAGD